MRIEQKHVKHILVVMAVIITTIVCIIYNYRNIALLKYIPQNASLVVKLDLYKIARKTQILDETEKSPLLELLLDNEIGNGILHAKESGISLYYPIYGALYADTSIKSMQVQNLVIVVKITDAEQFKKFVEKTHNTLGNSNQKAELKNSIYRYNASEYSIVWNDNVATINVFNARNAYTFVIREDMWLGISILKSSEKQTNHNIIRFNNEKQDIGLFINNESLFDIQKSLQLPNEKKAEEMLKIANSFGIQFNNGRIQLSSKSYLTAAQQQNFNIWKYPSTNYLNTLPTNPIALSSISVDLEKLKNIFLQLTSKKKHPIHWKDEFSGLSGDIGLVLSKVDLHNKMAKSQPLEEVETYNEEFQTSPLNNLAFEFQVIIGKKTPSAKPTYLYTMLDGLFTKVQLSDNRIQYSPKFGGATPFYLHTLNNAWIFSNTANLSEKQHSTNYPTIPIFGSINIQHPDLKMLNKKIHSPIYGREILTIANWIKKVSWRGEPMEFQMDIEMMDSNKNALNYIMDNGLRFYQLSN